MNKIHHQHRATQTIDVKKVTKNKKNEKNCESRELQHASVERSEAEEQNEGEAGGSLLDANKLSVTAISFEHETGLK